MHLTKHEKTLDEDLDCWQVPKADIKHKNVSDGSCSSCCQEKQIKTHTKRKEEGDFGFFSGRTKSTAFSIDASEFRSRSPFTENGSKQTVDRDSSDPFLSLSAPPREQTQGRLVRPARVVLRPDPRAPRGVREGRPVPAFGARGLGAARRRERSRRRAPRVELVGRERRERAVGKHAFREAEGREARGAPRRRARRVFWRSWRGRSRRFRRGGYEPGGRPSERRSGSSSREAKESASRRFSGAAARYLTTKASSSPVFL